MLFNPFRSGISNFLKQANSFLEVQNAFLESASHFLPNISSTEMTVLHPDPRDVGEWKRQVFKAPQDEQDKFVNRLDYYTFIPSPTEGQEKIKYRGLVVMLHGCNQNASVFAQGTRMNLYAQHYGFVVLYPQQNKLHNLAQCWRWFDLSPNSGLAEANTIMELIEQTIKKYDIDPVNVFIAGMSAGSGMTTALAFSFPDRIAAVALHSGPVFNKARNATSGLDVMLETDLGSDESLISYLKTFAKPVAHHIPTLIIHGLNDKAVNISNARALSKQALYLNKLPLNTKPVITKHDTGTPNAYTKKIYYGDNLPIVKLIEVDNMSHDWAGGDTSLPFNTEYGPNSSQTILRFFYNFVTLKNKPDIESLVKVDTTVKNTSQAKKTS